MVAMLSASLKPAVTRAINPIARGALRMGLTPNAVTFTGAIGVVTSALYFYPKQEFFIGTLLIVFFALSDLFDGAMARISQIGASRWGGFLDSTLDRISDSAVICALIYFYVNTVTDNSQLAVVAGIVSLVMSLMTSYARAKAESLDAKCTVGIAERAERNLIIWLALLISGFFVDVMPYALVLLAVASTITVVQRILFVRKQLVLKV